MLSQHLLLSLEMYHAVNVFCCCSKVHIRWRVCVTDVDNALGFALGVMFVNETFDKKTKPEAEKMIKLITKAFRWKQILIQVQIHFHFFFIRNGFVEVDWMDNITFTFTNPLSLFRNGLEEADWMDNATRRKAEEKVNHVVT